MSSSKANKLQKGMSVDQITKLLGQPHRVRAENDDKAIVLTYVLPDRSEVHIALGPELVWAKRIMAGAEVEIVI